MKLTVNREENQKISKWSGGSTRELAIFPEDSEYLDRDFIWRLSTADSDKDESSFTRLEGFDRILMVLEGDVVLAHGQERSVHLGQLEQDSFDGGIKTKCFGRLIKDYNLIMAKGCRGSLEVIELSQEAKAILPDDGKITRDDYRSYGIYSIEGYTVISADEKSEMIRPGEQAVIRISPGEDSRLSLMGEGRCILARVAFSPEDALEDIEKAGEKDPVQTDGGFASSYAACLKLFMRSNKWSKVMRREGADNIYYDKAMSKALAGLERRYVTTIVWAVGCLCCFIPAIIFERVTLSIGLAALFTVIHIFVIAPLIYYNALPSPISAHMKNVDDMDAFERIHHEEEIAENPHLDRVLSKYTSDDENYFTDKRSVFYKLVKKDKK